VRVRYAVGVQARFECRFIDGFGLQPARSDLFRQQAGAPREFGTAAVGDEQIEDEATVLRGPLNNLLYGARSRRSQAFEVSEYLHAHALTAQLLRFTRHVLLQKRHERRYLALRPAPVLL